MVKFIKYLPQSGWHPTVLAVRADKDYSLFERSSESLLDEIPSDVAIYRTQHFHPPRWLLGRSGTAQVDNRQTGKRRTTLFGALKSVARNRVFVPDENIVWVPFALRAGKTAIKKSGSELILATCPPYSNGVVGRRLKQKTGLPLVLDIRDDLIEMPVHQSKSTPGRKRDMVAEAGMVHVADRVVCVTEWSCESFRKRYSYEAPDKFIYIPNGCDLGEYERTENHRDSGSGQFRIVHSGVLPPSRDPGPFFLALREVLTRRPDLESRIEIVLVGKQRHTAALHRFGLKRMAREIDYVSRQDYLDLIHSADLLLVIAYTKSANTIPGKIYEHWATGNPQLLLADPGEAQRFVETNHLGLACPPEATEKIASFLIELIDKAARGCRLTVDRAGLSRFDRAQLTRNIAGVFDQVLVETERGMKDDRTTPT